MCFSEKSFHFHAPVSFPWSYSNNIKSTHCIYARSTKLAPHKSLMFLYASTTDKMLLKVYLNKYHLDIFFCHFLFFSLQVFLMWCGKRKKDSIKIQFRSIKIGDDKIDLKCLHQTIIWLCTNGTFSFPFFPLILCNQMDNSILPRDAECMVKSKP